ncbi:MAG: hypothetical protein JO079_00445, partial [Frankiaceae bacterium]|nr:hypothetical protein [Frankiaceae bacterium]
VDNPTFDPTFILPSGADPNDPRLHPHIGPGATWLRDITHSLHQYHWERLPDGTTLVFMVLQERVPHFRTKWEEDAPEGCVLLPSLLDPKGVVPAIASGHPSLAGLGITAAHTTFDLMRTLYRSDPQRYPLARPDHY